MVRNEPNKLNNGESGERHAHGPCTVLGTATLVAPSSPRYLKPPSSESLDWSATLRLLLSTSDSMSITGVRAALAVAATTFAVGARVLSSPREDVRMLHAARSTPLNPSKCSSVLESFILRVREPRCSR
jgi:hypothetical protein